MDIFGASRNLVAHDAVMEVFGNPTQTKRPDLCERYLWALAQLENCPGQVAKGIRLSALSNYRLFKSLSFIRN